MTKVLTGKVIQVKKLPKTITVEIQTSNPHFLYKKAVKKHKKILVHHEGEISEGEIVKIVETRPISKRKHFKVLL